MRRLCDEGVHSYLGTPRLEPERATVSNRSGVSAEVIVVGGSAGKAQGRRRRTEREGVFNDMPKQQARRQMPAHAGRTVAARGEAAREAVSDEACGSLRYETRSTGSALL